MTRSLQGRVALITGSTRGIGLAIAEAFVEAGAQVVISSRKLEACERVRDSFLARGHRAIAIPCHIGKPEQLEALVEGTQAAYGRIDIVVANAAVNPVLASLDQVTEDVWTRVFDANVGSTWRLAKLALPHLMARGGGVMVMISSIAGVVPSRGDGGVYGISKAAENHLARQLAVEWAPHNIRVNAIAPGATRTDMLRNVPVQTLAMLERRTPLGRIAEPADIAAIALFLASDASRHLTGQVLIADGGLTLHSTR